MNIYIFSPYSWAYCGGMCVAIAETFKEAKDMLEKYFKKDDPKYNGVIARCSDDSNLQKDHWDQWVLEDSYPVGAVERKVIVNFNDS